MALQTKSIPIVAHAGWQVFEPGDSIEKAYQHLNSEIDSLAQELDLAPNEYSVEIAASDTIQKGYHYHAVIYANFIYEIK